MKVWFPVIKGSSGTDVFTRRLADALERRGIGTEITWFSPHFEFAPFLLRTVPPPPGTDIIHVNSWNGFAFKRPQRPLVVTKHLNVLDPVYRPYKNLTQHFFHKEIIRRFEKASYCAASAITAVSQYTASSPDLTAGAEPVQVIYNWINTSTFTPPKYHAMNSKQPFRLLFVGNPTRRKGVDLLAPIMNELGPKFELLFTAGLRALKAKHVTGNMRPLGHISRESKLIEVYHHCDAVLFPSRLEGFSLVSLEAMACGKPVIASNIPPLQEAVEDRTAGLLCPMDDISAFVAACRKLAEDPQILRQYGQAARRRAECLFSEDTIIPQYVSLYQKLLDC